MKTRHFWLVALVLVAFGMGMVGCSSDDDNNDNMSPEGLNPDTAPRVSIDRFSATAGHLFVRDGSNGLPAANAPINMDQEPFVTHGLAADGNAVSYYNFDVMSQTPAPIYVLQREGETNPVAGQLNIVDDIPGDTDYNDFWRVNIVSVSGDYIANTIHSFQQIVDMGLAVQEMNTVVNCPIVPEGSSASLGGGANGLTRGWYRDSVVTYFNFDEAGITAVSDMVPTSPILVCFNINPDQTGGGPASGFKAEGTSSQTHNVVATVPGQGGYSPLWDVTAYDNAAFDMVHDWASAAAVAPTFDPMVNVNCPIVAQNSIDIGNPDTAPRAHIDRFSDAAGHLFKRSGNSALPAADEAIDMDVEPFITHGLGPDGGNVTYYNFDVMPQTPAPIYVLQRDGESSPVAGQLNIVDDIPGDADYNDFWRPNVVTVPADYVANTITSVQQIIDMGLPMEQLDVLVNCPVVPEGSTADLGGGANGLTRGWYRDSVVTYFNFDEAALAPAADMVPTSPILVCFNINPDEDGGGPPSGFKTEPGTDQTHNVVATIPGQGGYSPLWDVTAYDNAEFDNVSDWTTAAAVTVTFDPGVNVNCPVVMQ
ncbi:MAG: hypothetical protein KDB65_00705 [Calditrichaeota bacterium]|nr:hypothetical protein [Calditrichota bacterium]MCB9369264.1 hypothetical protein [Calditrichota bacterium]